MRHARENSSWWRRALHSRLALSINLLLVGFVGWSLAREVAQGNEVYSDLDNLKKQISELEVQNDGYADIISKLGTSGFVEREARLKLGYQKPGEQVIMLRDPSAPSGSSFAAEEPDSELSNPQKWWRYFFGRE